jgi:aldehyde dehydrogenase (NAD+)
MRQPLPSSDLAALVQRQRDFFLSDATRPLAWRLAQLATLEKALRAFEDRLLEALHQDLGKSREEGYGTELGLVHGELKHVQKHLARWMKPQRSGTPLVLFPGASSSQREPLGVALLLAPWNYPAQLTFVPLIGALAAGCTAVIKPSEHAPATAKVVEALITAHFDPAVVTVVQGGPEVSQALLELSWDTIFFTGSPAVGRIVAEAAARQLTPVTLELGGKSPALVAADTNLEIAARRIGWGKVINAGQSCVAPDYVLVDRKVKDAFIAAVRETWSSFFGPDPRQSPDYGHIVTERHFRRIEALKAGGRTVAGGESDSATRFIAPTILDDVDLESPLMQEEIFGPLLPVIPVDDMEAAIRFVRARPRPLTLYLFSNSVKIQERVLAATSSGSAMINDTMMHLANPHVPFGGVGQSGSGSYHGEASFEAFSHRKTVVRRSLAMDVKFRYPPLAGRLSLLKRLLG